MKVMDCNSIEAAEVIRKRAETEQRSVIDTARAIAAGGVANCRWHLNIAGTG